ncbi:putative membrane protein YhfC [Spirochaetia bacterium]|nr:putative membrane protein YhfC [Spirochaetia bacterium]
MHISIFSIIFMSLSAILSIGTPVVLFIVCHKKYKAPALPMIIGAVAFIIFALVLEQFIHSIVLNKFQLREKPLVYILYGIFMAGIFEETARFISFKILKRKYNGIGTGLSYGIGHGGIEAILLAGIAMIYSIIYSIMINSGKIDIITGNLQGDKLDQINIQINTLVTTAPYLFLISGIERLCAITIQIALSIIVYHAVFTRHKVWFFPLAILLHAIIDTPAAAMQVGVINNVVIVEGIIGISSILLLLFAVYIHRICLKSAIRDVQGF